MMKKTVKTADNQLHKNHRERMRNKYLETGLDTMDPHEVLEIMLYNVIPRQDTNPIAHRLINTFGSFHGVLDASVEDLMKVEGLGKNAAVFLKLFPDVRRFYEKDKQKNKKSFKNVDEIGDYLLPGFMGKKQEMVLMLTLSAKNEAICTHILMEGSLNSASFDIKKIVGCSIRDGASKIVLAHNHPGGLATPSVTDRKSTLKIMNMLQMLDIELIDHLIYADEDYVSMSLSGLLKDNDHDTNNK
ncbi:MAG: DNA repair protein RadC [Clostridia bacterium]|nr:DNA repair protein RadC [Clostridia bacterium]